MSSDLPLGSIAGIEVRVHWSSPALAGVITWILGSKVLPVAVPGTAGATRWSLAIAGAVTLLVCVVAHEIAHALVARVRGIRVGAITLWMFGGVARLDAEPPDAQTELRVAMAGPLTSLALGGAFGLLAVAMTAASLPDPGVALWAWLASVNVILAVFNLVPAYPLDGGRVLRGLIWRETGDGQRAAIVATRFGRRVGYSLTAVGLGMVLAGTTLGGLWTALIGWIVLRSPPAEGVSGPRPA
jgi:Zn-dependent protease